MKEIFHSSNKNLNKETFRNHRNKTKSIIRFRCQRKRKCSVRLWGTLRLKKCAIVDPRLVKHIALLNNKLSKEIKTLFHANKILLT